MAPLTTLLLTLALGGNPMPLAAMAGNPVTDTTIRFPRVDGRNLEGRRFALPMDFAGERNVVLVAFRREQQADVDTWLPLLRELSAEHADVRVYELPTMSRGISFMRRFIDGGMKRGIPELATREATITLYIDKGPFQQALAISSDRQITAFVVTRDGRVLWRADGPVTDAAAASLRGALKAP
jgi:hypothetical protein